MQYSSHARSTSFRRGRFPSHTVRLRLGYRAALERYRTRKRKRPSVFSPTSRSRPTTPYVIQATNGRRTRALAAGKERFGFHFAIPPNNTVMITITITFFLYLTGPPLHFVTLPRSDDEPPANTLSRSWRPRPSTAAPFQILLCTHYGLPHVQHNPI